MCWVHFLPLKIFSSVECSQNLEVPPVEVEQSKAVFLITSKVSHIWNGLLYKKKTFHCKVADVLEQPINKREKEKRGPLHVWKSECEYLDAQQ